jgi:hypothetical protein
MLALFFFPKSHFLALFGFVRFVSIMSSSSNWSNQFRTIVPGVADIPANLPMAQEEVTAEAFRG